MKAIIWQGALLYFFCNSIYAQTKSEINDQFDSSIISKYLLKLYPDTDENVLGSGRHYDYVSFYLPVKTTRDTFKILNFGENTTHRPSLMLILVKSEKSNLREILLGEKSIETDLVILRNLFDSYVALEKNYKLEILDIWLQSRKGIEETSRYLH
jgi:hypothetical protein